MIAEWQGCDLVAETGSSKNRIAGGEFSQEDSPFGFLIVNLSSRETQVPPLPLHSVQGSVGMTNIFTRSL